MPQLDHLSPNELADIVEAHAARSDRWMESVRLCHDRRWYRRLHHGQSFDVWLISWLPGQSTGFHDHGASSGAFFVATGALEEHRMDAVRTVGTGQSLAFGPDYAHDVRNVSSAPAISIHAYSPPLTEMNEYDLDGHSLIKRAGKGRQGSADGPVVTGVGPRITGSKRQNIDQMLEAARARLRRLTPREAFQAASQAGALLVDIRPAAQRGLEGSIPGALIVERNVLEWRFDPTSSAKLPVATHAGLEVIIFCSEGYTSSLAASSLQELGLWRATDIIGGFQAWQAESLPHTTPDNE